MGTLVVYDSLYGNTEKIARAIGDAMPGEVEVVRLGEVNPSELKTLDLLIVGSPTQGGRPTPAIQDFLSKVPLSALNGSNVAAFDTRFAAKLAAIFGYAAGRIADTLKRKGATLVLAPEGFFVNGTKGPLKEGEIERAVSWGKEIVDNVKRLKGEA